MVAVPVINRRLSIGGSTQGEVEDSNYKHGLESLARRISGLEIETEVGLNGNLSLKQSSKRQNKRTKQLHSSLDFVIKRLNLCFSVNIF